MKPPLEKLTNLRKMDATVVTSAPLTGVFANGEPIQGIVIYNVTEDGPFHDLGTYEGQARERYMAFWERTLDLELSIFRWNDDMKSLWWKRQDLVKKISRDLKLDVNTGIFLDNLLNCHGRFFDRHILTKLCAFLEVSQFFKV